MTRFDEELGVGLFIMLLLAIIIGGCYYEWWRWVNYFKPLGVPWWAMH